MILADVHCHLDHARFKNDLDQVIERARQAGVKSIITSGVNSATNRLVLEIAAKYDIVNVSFGLYPIDALAKELEDDEVSGAGKSEILRSKATEKSKISGTLEKGSGTTNVVSGTSVGGFVRDTEPIDVDAELDWIKKNKEKCVAIGEAGLDYHWVTGKEKEQQKTFQKVIELVEKIDKPLIVHSRKAELDAVEMLESSSVKKIVMHCFHGSKKLILRAADNGWFFSIPPNITRLQHFQMMIDLISLNQVLTETDAPYLSPFPGQRNESAFVVETIKKIAEIKSFTPEEVANNIWLNYTRVF